MKFNKVTVTCYYAYDGQDLGKFGMIVRAWNNGSGDYFWNDIKDFDRVTKYLKNHGYYEEYKTYNSLVDQYAHDPCRSITTFFRLRK